MASAVKVRYRQCIKEATQEGEDAESNPNVKIGCRSTFHHMESSG